MTQGRERSVSVPPQLGTRAARDADGPPRTSGTPAARYRPDPDLPDEVRKELDRLIVELGERGIGGTWTTETEFRVHTIGELDATKEAHAGLGAPREKLTDRSTAGIRADRHAHVRVVAVPGARDRSLVYRTLRGRS